MKPQDHRGLVVWQRAIELAILTHLVAEEFTVANRIAYAAQLRRSATSVAANIAEGAAREHLGELIQFLSYARGSLAELHTHYEIVGRLKLVNEDKLKQVNDTIDHVARMLTNAIKELRRRR
jgi:four helix bundle protein